MSTNVVNQVAYIRTSREYPEDLHQFTVEVNKTYVDIANAVNTSIGAIFPTNRPAITREGWFLTGNLKQQGFRQVYNLTTTAGVFNTINHGILVTNPAMFTPKCYGSYTDGTNSYGLIFASNSGTTIPGQISFYITANQVIFLADAAAPTPTVGLLLLEWISNP
jgi:hypothetical protein